jgi:hypothetical protein
MPSHWLRWDLKDFLPGLAVNLDPLDLCLPNTWDYECEPWHLAPFLFIYSFLAVRGFELRASHLLGRHSTT